MIEPEDVHFDSLTAMKRRQTRGNFIWQLIVTTIDGRRAFIDGYMNESLDCVLDRAIEKIRRTVAA